MINDLVRWYLLASGLAMNLAIVVLLGFVGFTALLNFIRDLRTPKDDHREWWLE